MSFNLHDLTIPLFYSSVLFLFKRLNAVLFSTDVTLSAWRTIYTFGLEF